MQLQSLIFPSCLASTPISFSLPSRHDGAWCGAWRFSGIDMLAVRTVTAAQLLGNDSDPVGDIPTIVSVGSVVGAFSDQVGNRSRAFSDQVGKRSSRR